MVVKFVGLILQVISVVATLYFVYGQKEYITKKVDQYPSSRPFNLVCALFTYFFWLIFLIFKRMIAYEDYVHKTHKLIKCRRDLQIGYFVLMVFGTIPQIVVLVVRNNPVIVFAFCIACNLTPITIYLCFILEHIGSYSHPEQSGIWLFKLKIFLAHLIVTGVISLLNWLFGSEEHALLVFAVYFFYSIVFSTCTMELCAINMYGVTVNMQEDGYHGDTNPYDYRAHIQARRRAQQESEQNEDNEARVKDKESQFSEDRTESQMAHSQKYITHGIARAAERRAQLNTSRAIRVSMVEEESHVSIEDGVEDGSPSSAEDGAPDPAPQSVVVLNEEDEDDGVSIPNSTCLECNVCMLHFSSNVTPRILVGCGHTICQGCVSNLVMNDSVVCPYCRKSTNVPGGVGSRLPKNYAILGMIQELRGGEGSS